MKRTKEILISLLLLAFAIYFFRAATQIGQTAGSDLLNYWKLNEGTGAIAYDDVGVKDGTLYNNPTWKTESFCKLSKCLGFDGADDYIGIGGGFGTLVSNSSYTVSLWAKSSNTTKRQIVIGDWNSGGAYESFTIEFGGYPEATFSGRITTNHNDGSYDYLDSGVVYTAGTWYHVAVTWDQASGLRKIYIDGVFKNQDTQSSLANGVSLSLGRAGAISSAYLLGDIDDVRVYSRALTEPEIETLFQTDLIAHWSMDEGADTPSTCNATLSTVYDYVGSNNGDLNLDGSPATSTAWTDGKLSCGLDLDGVDDYVEVGDKEEFQFGTRDFSITAWFYFNGNILQDAVLSKRSGSSPFNQYSLFICNGHPDGFGSGKRLMAFIRPDGGSTAYDRKASTTADLTVGWHHAAMVQDYDSKLTLYLDGVEVSSDSSSHAGLPVNIPGRSFQIGKGNSGFSFDGIVDEVRVYNRVLAAGEVEVLAGLTGASLSSHWKMDEGAGITAFDDVGVYDGTLVNGAAWLSSSSCRVDGCLYFDSDNDAVAINAEPIGTGADSACAWIYPISGGTDPYPRILDNGRFILYVQAGEEIAFTSDTNTYLQTTTDVVQYNTWQHVCAVRDASGNAKIYIDGVEKASGSSGIPTVGTTNVFIGNNSAYTRTFYGRIDDARIYGGVLTEPEIQVLASMGEPPPPPISTNVFGWAWNDGFGWTSFNCTNCETNPSCDKTATCNGTHPNYGVFIDEATGIMSGYAWSENVGWFSFKQTDLAGCPVPPCWAFIDLNNGQVSGWAKIMSGSWLRLRDTDYGVYLDSSSEFRGHAWSDEFGWLSFNHLNCDPNSDGVSDKGSYNNCPIGQTVSDYMVWTSISIDVPPSSPPTAVGLNVAEVSYCDTPQQFFSWIFQDPDVGDSQLAYHLQVDKEGDWIAGAGEFDSGKIYNPNPESRVVVAQYAGEQQLEYNRAYFWRLKVWDSTDIESGWVSGTSFITPTHIYPTPGFDWTPAYPASGEVVQFCAVNDGVNCFEENSTCYDNSNNEISCSGKSFLWTFPLGTEFETGSTENSENPQVKLYEENAEVTLEITDSMGTCGFTDTINITLPLPKWQETTPK